MSSYLYLPELRKICKILFPGENISRCVKTTILSFRKKNKKTKTKTKKNIFNMHAHLQILGADLPPVITAFLLFQLINVIALIVGRAD